MIEKPFDQITAQDINALVTNKIPERKTLEYKEALPGNADSDRKECTADITSFANTQGGDLLYGITEERDATTGKPTGIPKEALGLAGSNPDQDILRLTTLVRDTTDPRLTNLQAKPIDGFPDGPVILFRIQDSWNKPHMVTTNGRFYARTSSGKYPMDTNEVRDLFLQTHMLTTRIKAFRNERIHAITSDNTPVTLPPGPRLILHLIPYQAMTPGFTVNVTALERHSSQLAPVTRHVGWSPRYNFDGFLNHEVPDKDGNHAWYILAFRNGIMELTHTEYHVEINEQRVLPTFPIEREIIQSTKSLWRYQKDPLGLNPPFVVMITITNVANYLLDRGTKPGIDRDTLALPEIIIEDATPDVAAALRPAFDALWQAGGQRECQDYDVNGTFKPPA